MKKLCSILLVVLMVFGALPAGVLAADNYVAGINENPFGEFSLKAQIGEYIYTVDSMGNLNRLNLQTENRDSFVKQIGGIDEFITNGKFIYYQGYEPDGVYQVDISTRESKRILDNRVDKLETSSTDAELHYIFNGEHCVKALQNYDEEILSYDAAVAYKSVVDNAIAKYGAYNKEQYTGVGLARLIDFDGNGTLELLIGCGHSVPGDECFFEVYGYNDGIFQLTHTYACDSMQLVFNMNLTKMGNSVYAVTWDSSICDSCHYYGSVSDDKWVTTEYYSYSTDWDDGSIHPELYGTDVYKLNGNLISEKEYQSQFEKYENYDAEPYSEYVNFGEKGTVEALNTLNDVINNSGISNKITVTLNGKEIDFDQTPIIVDGRTLVPLRAIFEALGATVDWNGTTQTVTSTKEGVTISMTIGQTEMYKNGEVKRLDVAPQIIGGRTLVPVRAIAESFDIDVEWNGDTNTVILDEY